MKNFLIEFALFVLLMIAMLALVVGMPYLMSRAIIQDNDELLNGKCPHSGFYPQ